MRVSTGTRGSIPSHLAGRLPPPNGDGSRAIYATSTTMSRRRGQRCARRLLAGPERAPRARQWIRSRHARKGIRAARRRTTATATGAAVRSPLGRSRGSSRSGAGRRFSSAHSCARGSGRRPRGPHRSAGLQRGRQRCNEVGNPGSLCSPGRLGGLKRVMVPVCDRLDAHRSSDGSCLRGTAQLRADRRPHQRGCAHATGGWRQAAA
jgi:hypothetical protein